MIDIIVKRCLNTSSEHQSTEYALHAMVLERNLEITLCTFLNFVFTYMKQYFKHDDDFTYQIRST